MRSAKTLGLNTYLSNKDIPVLSTEKIEDYEKFIEENKNKSVIGTHSGAFHADEVLSCVMLKFTNNFRNSVIVRSRNKEINKKTDILVDVGGIYDEKTNRFDHHMKEFNYNFDSVHNIKMSSAGLVYKYYGKEVLENILSEWNKLESHKSNIDLIYQKLYKNFIMSVDAEDNGISQYPDTISPKYINVTNYGSRIARQNPPWTQETDTQSECFKSALDVAEDEFLSQVNSIVNSWLPAYEVVKKAIVEREKFHPSGEVFFLERSCPWKEHLFTIEEELNIKEKLKFCVFPSPLDHRVQTVPKNIGSFQFRQGIKNEWRGVNQEELKKLSGIEDIVFVHTNGFIGSAVSLESAVKMCEISLKNE